MAETSSSLNDCSIINELQQKIIDLKIDNSPENDEIVLKNFHSLLEKDLSYMVLSELNSIILSCFSSFPEQLLPIFDEFFAKSKTNANYIIITTYLLSKLTKLNQQLTNPKYDSFVDDALNEVLPQLKNKTGKNLLIFDHEISPFFEKNVVLCLLLLSKQKEKIVLDNFQSILSFYFYSDDRKFDKLFSIRLNSKEIQILPQNDESNQQLFEFITKRDTNLISSMNPEAFSIVESAVNFVKNKKINGFSKENSLQFISIVLIYIQGMQLTRPLKLTTPNNSLIEMITSPEITSPVLNSLCDLLFQNIKQLYDNKILSNEDLESIYNNLTQRLINDSINSDKKIALMSIFDFTCFGRDIERDTKTYIKKDNLLQSSIKNFLLKNYMNLLSYIMMNASEINKYEGLKYHNLSLKDIDIELDDFITDEISHEKIYQFVYFLNNFCVDKNFIFSKQTDDVLFNAVQKFIPEKKFYEMRTVYNFAINQNVEKKSYFKLNHIKIPFEIEKMLNLYNPKESDNIDTILKCSAYHGPFEPEWLKIIYEKINESKTNYQCCLTFYCSKYQNTFYKQHTIYQYFRKPDYKFYKDSDVIPIIKNVFYFYKDKFIRKPEFKLSSLPISELGSLIVLKIFNYIEMYPNNYQYFYYLKNICDYFPILFVNLSDKIFQSVLQPLSNFHLTCEEFIDEKAKCSYSAFSFIISTFKAPTIIDKFINWLFTNITTFDDSQVCGFLNVLNCIYNDSLFEIMVQPWIFKTNFLSKIQSLLDRKIATGRFNDFYRDSIYILLTNIYKGYSSFNVYKTLQIDEYMKNVEYPISHLYNDTFLSYFYIKPLIIFYNRAFNIFVNKFEFNVNLPIDEKLQHCDYSFDTFVDKFKDVKISEKTLNLPSSPTSFSIKMARYLLNKQYWIYSWFLFSKHFDIVPKQQEILVQVIKDLNEMKNNENENEDEENKNVNTFNVNDYFKDKIQYKSLFASLIQQITNEFVSKSVFESLCQSIQTICKNKDLISIIIELISEQLNNYYDQVQSSQKQINSYVSILNQIRKENGFQESFLKYCSDILLNIVLSSYCRNNSDLLIKVAQIYIDIDNDKIPARCSYVCFYLITSNSFKNEINTESLELISKLTQTQIGDVGYFVENKLDEEISKNELTQNLKYLIQYYPQSKSIQALNIINLLKELLDKLESNINNEELLNDIIFLLNEMAPKRGNNLSLSYSIINRDNDSFSIPIEIKNLSPPYWDLFLKHRKLLLQLLQSKKIIYKECTFLTQFPEIIDLNTRITLFRNQMKAKKKSNSIRLEINRRDILTSSFNQFQKYNTKNFYGNLSVKFINEKGYDLSGLKRDWFTKLSEEIMNPNYGLFDCSSNKMSYKPNNKSSSANPNDLEYFQFAGKFVALALIQGICIDTHFTSAFCKQILNRKPKLKDLQDFDEGLYKSLTWMQENDVTELDLCFDYGIDFFGEYKTIELKENGSQIKVTNENINEYIDLLSNFIMCGLIEKQVKSFCKGFNSLISQDEIMMFTPNELDLLICGIPEINANDFIENLSFEGGFTKNSPVVKIFCEAISKWKNEDLVKLLQFMTGSSRVPAGGFKNFIELSGEKLKIGPEGTKNHLPRASTCFNKLYLPSYQTVDEMNEKLMLAIHLCDTFELA